MRFNFNKFSKPKVFCIGLNKTGTTSIEKALKNLGYKFANQKQAALLAEPWAKRNFKPILDLCHTAEAFQDAPFSYPYTFQILEHHFPNAHFILSVRNNAEQWYQSLIRFHSKVWADGTRIPTAEDLKNSTRYYKGRPFQVNQWLFGTPANEPYQKDHLIAFYERHLVNVREYFRYCPEKLIEINVSNKADYFRLCTFLKKEPVDDGFPWLNKTKQIKSPKS